MSALNKTNVKIGLPTEVYGYGVGIGQYTVAQPAYGIALGYAATSAKSFNIAIGASSGHSASNPNSLSLGSFSNTFEGSSGINSVAAGTAAMSSGNYAIAIGIESATFNDFAIAIGQRSYGGGTNSIAIGNRSKVVNGSNDSISIGYYTKTNGNQAVALGFRAYTGGYSVAIGAYAGFITGTIPTHAVGIGFKALSNTKSVAIGYKSYSINTYATAIGYKTKAVNSGANVAVGSYSYAYDVASIAIGNRSFASGVCSIAIGNYAKSNNNGSVVLNTTGDQVIGSFVVAGYPVSGDFGTPMEHYQKFATNNLSFGSNFTMTADTESPVSNNTPNVANGSMATITGRIICYEEQLFSGNADAASWSISPTILLRDSAGNATLIPNNPVITLENYTTSNSQAWATPVIEIDGDTQLVFINVTNSSTNNVSFVAHLTLQSSFMHSNYTWHTLIIEQGSAFDTTDASL